MSPHQDVVTEVLKLPDGPQIGAFFDFDGTVISGYSVMAFIKEQIRRGHLSPRELVELLSAMATDADHYYYEPRSSDLDPVFEAIGLQLGGQPRLIK